MKKLFNTIAIVGLCGVSGILVAQQNITIPRGGGYGSSQGESGKDFSISLPMIGIGLAALRTREMTLDLEMNFADTATVALEISALVPNETLTKEEIAETGDSFIVNGGAEIGLLVSRYSQPTKMAGFFWTFGLGTRSLAATWDRKIDAESGYTLTGSEAQDEQGRYHHDLTAKGATGYGRLGYRYVADSVPFLIGAQFGLRHFANKVENSGPEESALVEDDERQSIKRRLMSSVDIQVNLGLVF